MDAHAGEIKPPIADDNDKININHIKLSPNRKGSNATIIQRDLEINAEKAPIRRLLLVFSITYAAGIYINNVSEAGIEITKPIVVLSAPRCNANNVRNVEVIANIADARIPS